MEGQLVFQSKRLQRFEQLIFSELASYKQKKLEEGKNMIDLSIGSPDQPPPAFIQQAIIEGIQQPYAFQYTLTGFPTFNEAVSSFYERKYQVKVDPNTEVLQTMGSQDALMHLPLAFVDEGDIVLLPDPGYTAYDAAIKIAGATIYPMPLLEENQFLPDLTAIPTHIAQKAKMMILNFPGNPVPALAPRDFFKQVVEFAKKYQIMVVHDFAYSELVFDGENAVSFLSVEGSKDIGIECNSLSKSFNMAGSRVGYVIGNKDIISYFRKLKSNLDYGVFAPVQHAATVALLNGDDFLIENKKVYEERRDILVSGLNEIGWNVSKPKATMFVWAKIPKGIKSTDFVYQLMDEAGVIMTPGIAFGKHGEGYVRIALVQPVERIREAVKRIKDSRVIQKVKDNIIM